VTLYTVVDDGYEVDICRCVSGVMIVVNYGEDLFLDQDKEIILTVDALHKELKKYGVARLYLEKGHDWKFKVKRH